MGSPPPTHKQIFQQRLNSAVGKAMANYTEVRLNSAVGKAVANHAEVRRNSTMGKAVANHAKVNSQHPCRKRKGTVEIFAPMSDAKN